MEFARIYGIVGIIILPVYLLALGVIVAACILYLSKNRVPHSYLLLVGSMLLLVSSLTHTVSGYVLLPKELISSVVWHQQQIIIMIARCIGFAMFAIGFRGLINKTTET